MSPGTCQSEKNDVDTKEEKFTKQSTSQSERSVFDPDVITEADIEKIWAKMNKVSAYNRKTRRRQELNSVSTDMTPTTDYEGMHSSIHPETLEEALDIDRKNSKMEEVLRTKRAKPKTYLTQVILYDNVSHQRLLEKKLHILHNRHKLIERNIKRKKETFIQQLESKQSEWTRLDERVTKKFDPDKMPDLTFKFGQLYHSADYPYQAAINTLKGIQPSRPGPSRKIQILPQVTFRKASKSESIDSDSGSSKIFITRLSKKKRNKAASPRNADNLPPLRNRPQYAQRGAYQSPKTNDSRPPGRSDLAPLRGRGQRLPPSEKNWMEDSRYITLTSLLGERFSPQKKIRSHEEPKSNLAW